MLTLERLKEILHYNPETGEFTWLVHMNPAAQIGQVAGSFNEVVGYIHIHIDRKQYKAHRLAWFYQTGCWPENEVDHDNRIKTDNRWLNLREATKSEQQGNRTPNKNNTSGHRGVYWVSKLQKWKVIVSKNYLGHFAVFEEACVVSDTFARQKWGKFYNG